MCTDFPLMQTELVASIPLFVDHTEANLVSYDITPTGCINACFKDNRTVCAQVTEDTVRQFVRLAAQEKRLEWLELFALTPVHADPQDWQTHTAGAQSPGIDVDGMADGTVDSDGSGVGAGWPRSVGETVSADGATVGAGVLG